MIERDIAIFALMQADHGLAPKAAGGQHIGLVDRGQPSAAAARRLERDARHALHFLGAIGAFVGCVRIAFLPFAEIDAAGQLAHDQQIDARRTVGLQRGEILQPVEQRDGPQIGIGAQRLAQAQQTGFGARAALIPFRPADCAQQNGIGPFAAGARGIRKRIAMMVDGDAAKVMRCKLQVETEARIRRFQHRARGGSDFGADAVTGQQDDVGGHAGAFCRSVS